MKYQETFLIQEIQRPWNIDFKILKFEGTTEEDRKRSKLEAESLFHLEYPDNVFKKIQVTKPTIDSSSDFYITNPTNNISSTE